MTPDYERLFATLRGRRSIRRFRPEPVSAGLVAAMLEAAQQAPSAGNRQAWRFLQVKDPALIQALGQAVESAVNELKDGLDPRASDRAGAYLANFLHFSKAPLLLCPIRRAGAGLLDSLQTDRLQTAPTRQDEDSLASVAAAITQLLLAAHTLGLGACWMTGPLVARSALERLLKVPQGWVLSALIPVGFPDEEPTAPARRGISKLVKDLGSLA